MPDGDCRRCRGLLAEHAHGTLDKPRRLWIERHLSACLACREEWDEWRALAAAVRHDSAPLPLRSLNAGWDDLKWRLAIQRDRGERSHDRA